MIRRTLPEILTRAKAELSINRTITDYQLPDAIDELVDWQLETGRGR